jgi:hypothetical protein
LTNFSRLTAVAYSQPLMICRLWVTKIWFYKYMPTVLRSGPYRLFFYAGDRDERRHIHIERDDRIAKFWLDPIRLQNSGGFSRTEIARIQRVVEIHQRNLMEAWDAYFGDRD